MADSVSFTEYKELKKRHTFSVLVPKKVHTVLVAKDEILVAYKHDLHDHVQLDFGQGVIRDYVIGKKGRLMAHGHAGYLTVFRLKEYHGGKETN